MIKEKTPCRGCQPSDGRKPTCHSWCDKYLSWKERANEQLKIEQDAKRRAYSEYESVRRNSTKKLKALQHKMRGGW